MTDNRERWKANVAIDVVVLPGLTVTPNFKYQDDYYGLNKANQLGLTDSRIVERRRRRSLMCSIRAPPSWLDT